MAAKRRLSTVLLLCLLVSMVLTAVIISSEPPVPGRNLQMGMNDPGGLAWTTFLALCIGGLAYYRFKPVDMGNVIDLQSEQQLAEIIMQNPGKTVIVDFTAQTCPYCVEIAPVYWRVSKLRKYDNKAIFTSAEAPKFQQFMMQAGVRATPTFVAYENGKVVKVLPGPPKKQLEKYFDKIILESKSAKKGKKSKSSKKQASGAAAGVAAKDEAVAAAETTEKVANEETTKEVEAEATSETQAQPEELKGDEFAEAFAAAEAKAEEMDEGVTVEVADAAAGSATVEAE